MQELKAADDDHHQQPQAAANDDHYLAPAPTLFTLSADNIRLGLKATDKESAAIRTAGQLLVAGGFVEPEYVEAKAQTRATGLYLLANHRHPAWHHRSQRQGQAYRGGDLPIPGWCAPLVRRLMRWPVWSSALLPAMTNLQVINRLTNALDILS